MYLFIYIRCLATGESMTDIMYSFRIGKSTVSKIVVDCCNVLWDELKEKVSAISMLYVKLYEKNSFFNFSNILLFGLNPF